MSTDYDPAITSDAVARYGARPEMLIQILHGINDRLGWIPEEAVRQLAEELNLSITMECPRILTLSRLIRKKP